MNDQDAIATAPRHRLLPWRSRRVLTDVQRRRRRIVTRSVLAASSQRTCDDCAEVTVFVYDT